LKTALIVTVRILRKVLDTESKVSTYNVEPLVIGYDPLPHVFTVAKINLCRWIMIITLSKL